MSVLKAERATPQRPFKITCDDIASALGINRHTGYMALKNLLKSGAIKEKPGGYYVPGANPPALPPSAAPQRAAPSALPPSAAPLFAGSTPLSSLTPLLRATTSGFSSRGAHAGTHPVGVPKNGGGESNPDPALKANGPADTAINPPAGAVCPESVEAAPRAAPPPDGPILPTARENLTTALVGDLARGASPPPPAEELASLRKKLSDLESKVADLNPRDRNPWERDKAAAHIAAFNRSYEQRADAPPEPSDYRTTMWFLEEQSCGKLPAERLIRAWATDPEWRELWALTPQTRWVKVAYAAGSAGDLGHPLNYAKEVLRRLATRNPEAVREPEPSYWRYDDPPTESEIAFMKKKRENAKAGLCVDPPKEVKKKKELPRHRDENWDLTPMPMRFRPDNERGRAEFEQETAEYESKTGRYAPEVIEEYEAGPQGRVAEKARRAAYKAAADEEFRKRGSHGATS